MHENIFVKNYDDRVNTLDSLMDKSYEQFPSFEEAYKNLQFRHKTLEHEYAVLENQFQLYSGETYGKINSLERDMDQLVEQKDRAYKTLALENKNLKEQNAKLRGQNLCLQTEVDKQIKKFKMSETELRNTIFNYQKAESKQRQIVLNFEKQLSLKVEQVQSLKDILNNQRMALLSKDQLVISKDNQIAELLAQLKSVSIELETQRQIEGDIKDSNYMLKREVEELRAMFDEMQAGLRNCQKCKALELKNSELLSTIKQLQEQSVRKDFSYSIERPQKRTIDTRKSRFEYLANSRKQLERHNLTDISVNEIRPSRDFYQPRSMKDSVVRRCRIALDKD